jgi:transposase
VINPAHAKALKGHKTDARDCAGWLELFECGLLRGSYIPAGGAEGGAGPDAVPDEDGPGPHLGDPAAGQKALESAGIKLGSVVSDITGKSATAMIEALIDGERRGRCWRTWRSAGCGPRGSWPTCRWRWPAGSPIITRCCAGCTGTGSPCSTTRSTTWTQQIAAKAGGGSASGPAQDLPGFGDVVAQAGWARSAPPRTSTSPPREARLLGDLCPGNNISAQAQARRTGDAGTYIKPLLIQAAWAAIRVRGRLQARYNRLVRRFGGDKNPAAKKKAITAIAHTLLKIAYQVLKTGTPVPGPGRRLLHPAGITPGQAGLPDPPAPETQPRLHHHLPQGRAERAGRHLMAAAQHQA